MQGPLLGRNACCCFRLLRYDCLMKVALGPLILLLGLLLLLITIVSNAVWPTEFMARAPQLAFLALLVVLLLVTGLRIYRGGRLHWTALLLLPVGLLAVALAGTFLWVDYRLADRDWTGAPDDPHKIWSTRGLVIGGTVREWNGTQNSIESIRRAFEHGARGVEVDVFFDPELQGFVVSHDRPYNLKNGELLMLTSLLDAVGEERMFWLDWKKLRHLEAEEYQQALDLLMQLTARSDLRERFYVEGEAPFRIRQARAMGLLTIFDTHPLADSHFLTPLIISLYKSLFYFGEHSVMALESGPIDQPIFGPVTIRALRDVPLFVYHVPDDSEQIRSIARQDNVRVIILSDQRLDRFEYLPHD